MKRKIKTRCLILEIQLFPEIKLFIDFDFHMMQLMEFWVKVLLIIIFSGLSNAQFTCWIVNLIDHIFKQGSDFLVITDNNTTRQDIKS